jgi:hypothetical protein
VDDDLAAAHLGSDEYATTSTSSNSWLQQQQQTTPPPPPLSQQAEETMLSITHPQDGSGTRENVIRWSLGGVLAERGGLVEVVIQMDGKTLADGGVSQHHLPPVPAPKTVDMSMVLKNLNQGLSEGIHELVILVTPIDNGGSAEVAPPAPATSRSTFYYVNPPTTESNRAALVLPEVRIVAPADGAVLEGDQLPLQFFSLLGGGEDAVDDNQFSVLMTLDDAAFEIGFAYGNVTANELAPGVHTVTLSLLRRADNAVLSNDSVSFTSSSSLLDTPQPDDAIAQMLKVMDNQRLYDLLHGPEATPDELRLAQEVLDSRWEALMVRQP